MLNNLAKSIFFLSLSGSFMVFAIFLVKAMLYHKLGKKWFYYIWIIVAARLIIPFGLPIQIENDRMVQEANDITSDPLSSEITLTEEYSKKEDAVLSQQSTTALDGSTGAKALDQNISAAGKTVQDYVKQAVSLIGLLWFAICLFFLGKGLLCYIRYSGWVKHNSEEICNEEILNIYRDASELLGIKAEIPVLSSPHIGSPLLIGMVRPRIILPEIQLNETSHLKYIFMHELIHFKRLDIYYKWLMKIVLCIHWFNPIVYLMSREINKACELSCDEAVIEKISYPEQRAYGDTLIHSMELASLTHSVSVSVTMVENIKHMKERLGAIMKYQRKSKFATWLAVLLTIMICTGASFHVAYADTSKDKSDTAETNQVDSTSKHSTVKINIQIDIKKLKADQQVTYGPYYIDKKDSWNVNIESFEGDGELLVADMKEGEAFNHCIVIDHAPDGAAFLVDEFKQYYIVVRNDGSKTLKNIKGSLILNFKGNYQSPKETKNTKETPSSKEAQVTKKTNDTNNLSEVSVDIPVTNGQVYVKNYGKYSLSKNDKILADLNWKGEGALMFLYTEDKYSEDDIENLAKEGILPLYLVNKSDKSEGYNQANLSANFAYKQNRKKIKLNFITTPNKPIHWENKVPETGSYYFYIIAEGNTGITDIKGKICLSNNGKEDNKEDSKEDSKKVNKEGNKLGHMNEWSGTSSEEATETGVEFHATEYTGDRIVYSFASKKNGKMTLKLKSSLMGDYEIIFITSDRTILKTIPAFSKSKEITLDQLPEGTVDMIIRSEKVSGTFYVDTVSMDSVSVK